MIEVMYQAMNVAAAETLENMAFVEVTPIRSCSLDQDAELMVVSLLMHDPVPGEFRLSMPRDLLLQIAETLYSMPLEELEELQLEDTLAELLNTLAGKFLNRVIPGEVYRLGLPEIEKCSGSNLADGLVRWSFGCGEENFCIEFTGESLPVDI